MFPLMSSSPGEKMRGSREMAAIAVTEHDLCTTRVSVAFLCILEYVCMNR